MRFLRRKIERILIKMGSHIKFLVEKRLINNAIKPDLISKKSYYYNVKISGDVSIGDYCKMHKVVLFGNISIGNNTSLYGPNLDIISKVNLVSIGNFCSIARNTSIQEYNHPAKRLSTYFIMENVFGETNKNLDLESRGPIVIGNDVWIGAHCVILSGAKIGNGAIIAANSVVNGEIAPFAIAGGSPAKVIKYRFSEAVIERVQEIKWWDWDHDKIKRNKHLFEGELSIEKLNVIN